VTESTHDNLPIHDEPTRSLEGTDGGGLSADALGEANGDSWAEGDDALKDLPGRVGEYEIKGLIGVGGMGRVFLAEHVRMRREVALKMLPAKRMADAVAVDRFYEEVRAASRLMHPNIVTAFDAGEHDGIHYFAMEYVDGCTLTQIVNTEGPLAVGDAASVIRQASLGLLHAHRAGIVHRDVKPGNLMRAADGTIKVLDLGLARLGNLQAGMRFKGSSEGKRRNRKSPAPNPEATGNKTGRLVGTLPFMSPEQLEDPEAADARSDIYSLGATLCFLLTGRTPFSGDFLEQVYGHRHGEIPDLMQLREDVDLRFSHIFSRMMAKSPGERYASLDEVIEDLAVYAEDSVAPSWLAEFARHPAGGEASTVRSGSTHGRTSRILGMDLGMFYAAAAEAGPGREVRSLSAGGAEQPLFRMAVASVGEQLLFGADAIAQRSRHPQQVAHCVPMYLGQPLVQRQIAGRTCPPEVLLALMLRRMIRNAGRSDDRPDAVALTVPSSYDQLHRRSLLQAANLAGFGSVRLVDRCLAVTQARMLESQMPGGVDPALGFEVESEEKILFVGLTGQATEVAVIRREASRLEQLATAGHWHHGTLSWLQRLVDLAAEAFERCEGFDPRGRLTSAARLQVACERAMNAFLLLPQVEVRIERRGKTVSVSIRREDWLARCDDLVERVRHTIGLACRYAAVTPESIDRCLILGPLLRIPALQAKILSGLGKAVPLETADRLDCARGAAACLAGELPGRGDWMMPPRNVSSQSIGIVVEDNKGRRRILPIIPRGTLLPARTNRRLTIGPDRPTMTLSLVESSGLEGDDWHALGRHEFSLNGEGSETGTPSRKLSQHDRSRGRNIGFELDINGLLTIRSQVPGMPGSSKLATLPASSLSEEDLAGWIRWLEEVARS
jgi:eukaryotic-like serine/threonine-protein kinase